MGKVYGQGPEVKCCFDLFLLLTTSRKDSVRDPENSLVHAHALLLSFAPSLSSRDLRSNKVEAKTDKFPLLVSTEGSANTPAALNKLYAQMLVFKYSSLLKGIKNFLGKCLILGLGQRRNKMKMGHLGVPESKKVPKKIMGTCHKKKKKRRRRKKKHYRQLDVIPSGQIWVQVKHQN